MYQAIDIGESIDFFYHIAHVAGRVTHLGADAKATIHRHGFRGNFLDDIARQEVSDGNHGRDGLGLHAVPKNLGHQSVARSDICAQFDPQVDPVAGNSVVF